MQKYCEQKYCGLNIENLIYDKNNKMMKRAK